MDEESPEKTCSAATRCWILFIVGLIILVLTPSFYYEHSFTPLTVMEQTAALDSADTPPSLPEERIVEAPVVEPPPVAHDEEESNDDNDPARRYHPIIERAAREYDVDPALVKAIIMAESNYNPRAVSRRGARGLMQLMPRTAEALGVQDIFDPEHNINGGVRYFRKLLDRFDGDVELALAAYNAGSRKVRMYRGVPPFETTQRYIEKVFVYYEHYKEDKTTGTESV